jgi:hypothetical protein
LPIAFILGTPPRMTGYAEMSDRFFQPAPYRSRLDNIAMFVALLATALAMGAALAHALELPNKIGLSREAYFTVQGIYRGWDRLAFLLLVEVIAMLTVVTRYRRTPRVFWPAVGALASVAAAQAVFWVWTFPANVATVNWTKIPDNWEILRAQWEYSHLAGAGFQTLAMAALIVAALRRRAE